MRLLLLILLVVCPAFAEDFSIRWGLSRDLQEMLAIERATNPAAWSEQELNHQIRQPQTVSSVVVHDHRVIGYMIYDQNEGSLDVRRFAVLPEYRDYGVADLMTHHLIAKLENKRPQLNINVPKTSNEELSSLLRNDFDFKKGANDRLMFSYNRNSFTIPTAVQMEKQTFYERLSISESANAIEIERAYRRKKRVAKSDAAHRLLDEAFSTLAHASKKKIYDEERAQAPSLVEASQTKHLLGGREEGFAEVARRAPKPKSSNLYERLGVPSNATVEVIEQAYRDAVKQVTTEEAQANLDEAYRVLGRPMVRRRYDEIMTGDQKKNKMVMVKFLLSVPEALPSTTERLGFNPHAVDPYDVLGTHKLALPTEIEAAYERARAKAPSNADFMAAIDRAHAILSNKVLREEYDSKAAKLDLKGKRALLDDLFSRADIYIENDFDRPREYDPKEEIHFDAIAEEKLDKQPPPGLGPQHLQTAAQGKKNVYDLYHLLEISADAGEDEVIKKLDAIDEDEVHILGITKEDVRLVLLDPKRRAEYDRFRKGLGSYVSDRDAIAEFVEHVKILNLLEQDSKALTVRKFSDALHAWRGALRESPSLMAKAIEKLEEVYHREAGKKRIPVTSRMAMLKALLPATRHSKKEFPDLASKDLSFRTKIVRDLVNDPKVKAVDLEHLLIVYLEKRPPDFLAEELRKKRDELRPPKPLVKRGASAADCEGFDAM